MIHRKRKLNKCPRCGKFAATDGTHDGECTGALPAHAPTTTTATATTTATTTTATAPIIANGDFYSATALDIFRAAHPEAMQVIESVALATDIETLHRWAVQCDKTTHGHIAQVMAWVKTGCVNAGYDHPCYHEAVNGYLAAREAYRAAKAQERATC